MPTLINIFEVPPAVADDEFIAWWIRTRDFLNDHVGPIPTALHRSVRADTRFRFVNVAQIDQVDVWRAAIDRPEFPGRDMPGTRYPALYEVVADTHEVQT
jgi:hypothetical protein